MRPVARRSRQRSHARNHSCAEFQRRHLDGVAGTLGFPLKRRVPPMFTTMLVAFAEVNRTLLHCLLGGWALALLFPTITFASLDMSPVVAACLLRR